MLAHTTRALTEAQREQWAVDGYLQLEGALSPAEVDFFSQLLDRVRLQPGYEPAPGKLPRGHYAWADHADPPAGGSTAEMQCVYSLVNSIALNVPQAPRVVLLWNGLQRPSFAGHLDTGAPLTPLRELIARVRAVSRRVVAAYTVEHSFGRPAGTLVPRGRARVLSLALRRRRRLLGMEPQLPRIAVIYATAQGSTCEIAEFIAESLKARGAAVELADVEHAPDLTRLDAVVLGSAVHDMALLPNVDAPGFMASVDLPLLSEINKPWVSAPAAKGNSSGGCEKIDFKKAKATKFGTVTYVTPEARASPAATRPTESRSSRRRWPPTTRRPSAPPAPSTAPSGIGPGSSRSTCRQNVASRGC